MRPSPSTISHKVTGSYSEQRGRGIAFGDPSPRVPKLEALALQGTGYDPSLAYLMSVISTWAYADERALASKLRYYGIEGARVRRIAVVNNALLVVATAYLVLSRSGKTGVLAFRGTDPSSFVTILADAEVMQRAFCGGMVHSGFFTNVEAIWDDTTEAVGHALKGQYMEDDGSLTRLEGSLDALYVTGHSLGGAMALLAAARLFHEGYADWKPKELIKGVYTFGQPMVGNQRFVDLCQDHFGDRLYRHVYRNDPVPHLPPRSELSYAHAGAEWRADRLNQAWSHSSKRSRRAPLAEALAEIALNAVETRFVANKRLRGYSIDDHMPSNYVEASRCSVDPTSVVAPTPRHSWIPPVAAEVVEAAREGVQDVVAKLFRSSNGA